MARKTGAKNKTVNEKIEEAIEVVAAQMPKATEAQAAEIIEAIDELQDILSADEIGSNVGTITFPNGSTIEVSKEENHRDRLVGYHPITKEPVYI